jgi:3-hydroxyisobutyrate dehydrogenase-like beta-hydroxyacid dehydrogenase
VITNLTERSERTKKLSDSAGIIDVKSDEELLCEATIVLSIVIPSEATALARRFASHISLKDKAHKNVIFVDMNAVAPQTVRYIASLFPHGNFVDGCIIGLPPRVGEYTSSIYLSGKHAQQVADALKNTPSLDVRVVGDQIGQASGLKMCYGTMTKGMTAVALHACVTARSFELDDVFFDELKRSMPYAFDMLNKSIPDMAPKAVRWVREVEEIANTHESVGLSPKMFEGAAETYRFVAERTTLGKEIIEDRKNGNSVHDVLEIMVESMAKDKDMLKD